MGRMMDMKQLFFLPSSVVLGNLSTGVADPYSALVENIEQITLPFGSLLITYINYQITLDTTLHSSGVWGEGGI